jgi:hypothetical protein
VTSTVANIGGAVAALPIGAIASKAVSLGPNALSLSNFARGAGVGAGIGAVEGGVQGFGAGEGGFANERGWDN